MNGRDIRKVLIVGAGTMGHGIAHIFAQRDFNVSLIDLNQKLLDHAIILIKSELNTLVDFGKLSEDRISTILEKINTSTDLSAAAKEADLVVEAINEIPTLKVKLLLQLEKYCSKTTIIASNTSGLDIFKITRKTVKNPERLIIHHWFEPPHIIPLVEIVPGRKTSKEVIQTSVALLKQLGKKPVVLKKFTDNFIVNKIQDAISIVVYSLLLQNIATPEDIDFAIKNSLGIRVPIIGVVQKVDFTGLDLELDIQKRKGTVLSFISEKVNQGYLGVKTGKGIYDYGGRKEIEILYKRNKLFIQMFDFLEKIKAFEPI